MWGNGEKEKREKEREKTHHGTPGKLLQFNVGGQKVTTSSDNMFMVQIFSFSIVLLSKVDGIWCNIFLSSVRYMHTVHVYLCIQLYSYTLAVVEVERSLSHLCFWWCVVITSPSPTQLH